MPHRIERPQGSNPETQLLDQVTHVSFRFHRRNPVKENGLEGFTFLGNQLAPQRKKGSPGVVASPILRFWIECEVRRAPNLPFRLSCRPCLPLGLLNLGFRLRRRPLIILDNGLGDITPKPGRKNRIIISPSYFHCLLVDLNSLS